MQTRTAIAINIFVVLALILVLRAWGSPGDITPTTKAFTGYSSAGGKAKATTFNDTLNFTGNVSINPGSKTINIPFATSVPGVIPPATVTIPASGTYTFPSITSSIWGRIIVGANVSNADFNMDSAGNVQILQMDSSGLILSNSSLSGHLCIGNSVAANPVVLYNRTSGSLTVLITGFYQ